MRSPHWLSKLKSGEQGTTLVEMLVVVTILGMGIGLVVTTVFQVLAIERFWRDEVVATKNLRQATSQFSGDLINTQSLDLADGENAASVTLQWFEDHDQDRSTPPISHTATYSLIGDRLIRNIDGIPVTVARDVTFVQFSRTDRVVTLDLTVNADQGTTKSTSFDTYMRFLGL